MSAVSDLSSSSHYYQRDTSKAVDVQKEMYALYPVLDIAYEIARDVAIKASQSEVSHLPAGLPFRVTKEFLTTIVERAGSDISQQTPGGLSQRNLDHLHSFFSSMDSSYFGEFANLQRGTEVEKKQTIAKLLLPLQLQYREATGRFQRIELHESLKQLSCFHYAIEKAGLSITFLPYLLTLRSTGKRAEPSDFVNFLKGMEMGPSAYPLQKGDILIYFNEDDQPQHAAVVADSEKKIVYSKFGNALPFAYRHYMSEMPSSYGEKYQVYRKQTKSAV